LPKILWINCYEVVGSPCCIRGKKGGVVLRKLAACR
jgi:hypothetical protein